MTPMRDQLRQDLQRYHQLRFPERAMSRFSLARVALTSRGFQQLFMHRCSLALQSHRAQAYGQSLRWRTLVHLFAPFEQMMKAVCKGEILEQTQFDGGVYLSDRGGIMLGAEHVGRGSVVHQNVTIGTNSITGGVPYIGENVWIGPGSIVYGAIKIGSGVTVLPGSVLTKSIPDGMVVQGNPARVMRRGYDNSTLLRSLNTDVVDLVLAGNAEGANV